ncbi:hypothetical protein T440DRAFT_283675 [Plenodomus tracheiphilus IPT5]|uniref:C2H2-type domain-containing protein n=1 Tax=Plenodomus tracheiphilus IPT5 TaxID=1408161 RepID=A0A6A7ARV0_9PLEO|nr:hypothetical protein T440DRAFT_283675 [Plenodomus tracheiphilus IPT5]
MTMTLEITSIRLLSCSLMTGKFKKRHELTEGLRSDDMRHACEMSPAQPHSDQALRPSLRYPESLQLPTPKAFRCPEAGCELKTFHRRSELNRHSRKHQNGPKFMCPVQYCPRVTGFDRKDKLQDHILSGHDKEELINCSRQGCSASLPRDLWAVHVNLPLQHRRKCPMPKCSFKPQGEWEEDYSLIPLRTHLLQGHEVKGRVSYAKVLARAGFAAETCDFLCPICPRGINFGTEKEFARHELLCLHGFRRAQGHSG